VRARHDQRGWRVSQATGTLADRSVVPERSAHKLLGLVPPTTSQWLADIGL
jgi:hypothetical protein